MYLQTTKFNANIKLITFASLGASGNQSNPITSRYAQTSFSFRSTILCTLEDHDEITAGTTCGQKIAAITTTQDNRGTGRPDESRGHRIQRGDFLQ